MIHHSTLWVFSRLIETDCHRWREALRKLEKSEAWRREASRFQSRSILPLLIEDSGPVPWGATTFVLVVRFIAWPAISITIIWALSSKTGFLDSDPMLWFSMMLMPTGPPALGLIALADVADDSEDDKMSIAKFLVVSSHYHFPVGALLTRHRSHTPFRQS